MNRLKIFFLIFTGIIFIPLSGFAQHNRIPKIAVEIKTLKAAYPDIEFSFSYNHSIEDYEIRIKNKDKTEILYWSNGSYLTKKQLSSKDGYRKLLYPFPEKLRDPADFTDEELQWITRFGSKENRRSGRISGTALFDAIYDGKTKEDVENHIVSISFLGKSMRIHRELTEPLKNVERKIRSLAAEDPGIKTFLDKLGTASGYHWRNVRDTAGKSFHSMGLALDILPKNLHGKSVYWNWEKNRGNDNWMLLPLSERWLPPKEVILIFESEGFIWGGRWPVWDNMHFEYRPELLEWRDRS